MLGPDREWYFYIEDMIRFSKKVVAYTSGMNPKQFMESGAVYDGTLRNLELIGEAAGNLPEEIRLLHSEIPWRQMIATRNLLIHGYLGIDDEIIWSISPLRVASIPS